MIATSISVLILLGHVSCHISFDPYALKLIHEKFEKKIDTNYFLYDKAFRQKEDSVECASEDGPYCTFLNGKSFNSEIETNNSDYLAYKQATYNDLLRAGYGVLSSTKQNIKKGSDFLFYDEKRKIFDELLYPQFFYRSIYFIFTFETFPTGHSERPLSRRVDFGVEAKEFNNILYPHLSRQFTLYVQVDGVFTPSLSTPIVDIGLKTLKRVVNSFGFLASDSELEEIRFGRNPPQGNFVFTKHSEGNSI